MSLQELPLLCQKHICLFLPHNDLTTLASLFELGDLFRKPHIEELCKNRCYHYWPQCIKVKPLHYNWRNFYYVLHDNQCFLDTLKEMLPDDISDEILCRCLTASVYSVPAMICLHPKLKENSQLITNIQHRVKSIYSNTSIDALKYIHQHFDILPDEVGAYFAAENERIDILNWLKQYNIFPSRNVIHILIVRDSINSFRWLYINQLVTINRETLALAKKHKSRQIANFIQSILDDQE